MKKLSSKEKIRQDRMLKKNLKKMKKRKDRKEKNEKEKNKTIYLKINEKIISIPSAINQAPRNQRRNLETWHQKHMLLV